MKKFIKGIIILLIILIILIGGFIFSPLLSMSAKKGIEHFGSKILHTKVSVDDVSINVLEGNVGIAGLIVGSPEGFKEPYVFKLDEISVDADMKSLRSDVIVINSIIIDAPRIVIEDMGANLKALMANLEKPVKIDDKSAADNKPEKRLIINDLKLTNANVKIKEGLEVKIPDINLKNIGTYESAASIKDAIAKILNSVSKESLKAVTEVGKESIKKTFRNLLN